MESVYWNLYFLAKSSSFNLSLLCWKIKFLETDFTVQRFLDLDWNKIIPFRWAAGMTDSNVVLFVLTQKQHHFKYMYIAILL